MLLLENGIFIRNSTAVYIPLIQFVQSTIVLPASIQNISFGFDCLKLSTDISTQLFSYISIDEYYVGRETSSSCTGVYPVLLQYTRRAIAMTSHDVFILYLTRINRINYYRVLTVDTFKRNEEYTYIK